MNKIAFAFSVWMIWLFSGDAANAQITPPPVVYPITVTKGGTGATTAATARSNLSAASSGANSDITSLSALSTPLSVPQGGTGAATITGLVKGNGASAFTAASSGTDYAPATSGTSILLGNGAGGFASYAGASCTNQFPRSISASGVATCATVQNTDLANSSFTLGSTSVSLGSTASSVTGLSLVTPTINTAASVGGTWTAAATWTLPALTLGGNVSSTGNPSLNIGTGALTAGAGSFTDSVSNKTYQLALTGNGGSGTSGILYLGGWVGGTQGWISSNAKYAGSWSIDDSNKGTASITLSPSTGSGTSINFGIGAVNTAPSTVASVTSTGFQGAIGATTPNTGAFTTLSATTNINVGGAVSGYQFSASATIAKMQLARSDNTSGYSFYEVAPNGALSGTNRSWSSGLYPGSNNWKLWNFDGTTVTTILDVASTGLAVTGALSATTSILSSGATSGIGYATGAGGTVTQGTSRTTGVTINKASAEITLFSAAGSTTPSSFTVTNSAVAATDVPHCVQKSGTDKYHVLVTAVSAGSFEITSYTTGGTTTEQPVFSCVVLKGVAN